MTTTNLKTMAVSLNGKKTKLKIKSELSKHLQEQFGFDSFKNPQEEIIKSLLAGKDTFVIMPTGGGKSLCYQLPAIISKGCAIIVSPLIALMKNQVDLVRGYNSRDNVAHFLNSTLIMFVIRILYVVILTILVAGISAAGWPVRNSSSGCGRARVSRRSIRGFVCSAFFICSYCFCHLLLNSALRTSFEGPRRNCRRGDRSGNRPLRVEAAEHQPEATDWGSHWQCAGNFRRVPVCSCHPQQYSAWPYAELPAADRHVADGLRRPDRGIEQR